MDVGDSEDPDQTAERFGVHWLSGSSAGEQGLTTPRGAVADFSMFVWQTKPGGVQRLAEILGEKGR
ncbi:hypothetical protein ACIBG0_36985 [Nocardia sp. NPDC050630]|uniref:hypothetical protein n=1 Tax=Nocardia sp. NPDC050630 TaxID=3364321 RepID=UPI0037B0726B